MTFRMILVRWIGIFVMVHEILYNWVRVLKSPISSNQSGWNDHWVGPSLLICPSLSTSRQNVNELNHVLVPVNLLSTKHHALFFPPPFPPTFELTFLSAFEAGKLPPKNPTVPKGLPNRFALTRIGQFSATWRIETSNLGKGCKGGPYTLPKPIEIIQKWWCLGDDPFRCASTNMFHIL